MPDKINDTLSSYIQLIGLLKYAVSAHRIRTPIEVMRLKVNLMDQSYECSRSAEDMREEHSFYEFYNLINVLADRAAKHPVTTRNVREITSNSIRVRNIIELLRNGAHSEIDTTKKQAIFKETFFLRETACELCMIALRCLND